MDTSSEDLDESMLDVIQRAEAFITAHTILNREAERSSSNIFDASDDSFRTATTDESSSANNSAFNSNMSAGPTTSNEVRDPSDGNENVRTSEDEPPVQDEVELLSDDSQSTVVYDINEPSVDRQPSVDNDDCIVIEDANQVVVDLCSPYYEELSPRSRRARRRRADAAPVLESISLDDTVSEPVPRAPTRLSPPSPKKRMDAAADFVQPSESAAPSVSVTCPICLESIFHQQAASTVCGHLFCNQCIRQEIQIRKKCPMCQRTLKRHQVHPIYFN